MAQYFDLRQTLGGSENSVSAAVQFNGKFSRNTIPSPCMIWHVRSLSRTAPTRRTRHLKIVKSTGITSTVNFPLFELPQAAFAPNIRVVTLKHNLVLERPIGGGLRSSKFLSIDIQHVLMEADVRIVGVCKVGETVRSRKSGKDSRRWPMVSATGASSTAGNNGLNVVQFRFHKKYYGVHVIFSSTSQQYSLLLP
ncbi:hypothetical protein L1887_32659 [Cichorium endivia]|nr:hypothetical protein L1887_32659 [Cichorium endivia]